MTASPNTAPRIAVVDDEAGIRELLSAYLTHQGFHVDAFGSGAALLQAMPHSGPDVVLLDLGLPGEDGFAIARQLREHWRCGLLIVSGRGDAIDKVVGLEVGADDYVTKPFDLRELLARIKAVLRRMAPSASPAHASAPVPPASPPVAAPAGPSGQLRFSGWMLNRSARRLTAPSGEDVALTSGEFDLLVVFLTHPGRVLSRDFLLEQTRGREAGPFDRTVDVQIGRLRRKLEADPQDPQIIKSVRGAGYVFVPDVTSA